MALSCQAFTTSSGSIFSPKFISAFCQFYETLDIAQWVLSNGSSYYFIDSNAKDFRLTDLELFVFTFKNEVGDEPKLQNRSTSVFI